MRIRRGIVLGGIAAAALWGASGGVSAEEGASAQPKPTQTTPAQTGPAVTGAPVAPATTGSSPATAASAPTAATAAAPAGEREYEFGDFSSQTLATKAWQALEARDYDAVEAYTMKCISLYESHAERQAAEVTAFPQGEAAFSYWALNDVATAYFILGKARQAQGRADEAQGAFRAVVDRFPYAQAWDPKGWFWKVAQAASDQLTTAGTTYDFGDYTSQTLTVKAWEALGASDHRGVELYTKKCFELYEADAKKQQASLTDFAPKDRVFNYWALNDVGTSYFILGESLMAQQRSQEARVAFERVVTDFGFAQCWDPKGWFWKVAVASRGRINKILAEGGS